MIDTRCDSCDGWGMCLCLGCDTRHACPACEGTGKTAPDMGSWVDELLADCDDEGPETLLVGRTSAEVVRAVRWLRGRSEATGGPGSGAVLPQDAPATAGDDDELLARCRAVMSTWDQWERARAIDLLEEVLAERARLQAEIDQLRGQAHSAVTAERDQLRAENEELEGWLQHYRASLYAVGQAHSAVTAERDRLRAEAAERGALGETAEEAAEGMSRLTATLRAEPAENVPPPSRADRILWNKRPGDGADLGGIDEIVIHDATVHVEQQSSHAFWIGITTPQGEWSGNFVFLDDGQDGSIVFFEQENAGITWGRDESLDDGWRVLSDEEMDEEFPL